MAAYTLNQNLVLATVAAGKIFATYKAGILVQYVAGDSLYIRADEYVRLGPNREGIFV